MSQQEIIGTSAPNRYQPPTFFINDRGGCIGRFYWLNTVPFPGGDWFPELFPIWGVARWFRP